MPILWEYTDTVRRRDWLGQSWVRTITIRAGEETWTIVYEVDGDDERYTVSGPDGLTFRPHLSALSPERLALAVIRHIARRSADEGEEEEDEDDTLEAVAQALSDPENPDRSEILKRLLATGQARIIRGGKS